MARIDKLTREEWLNMASQSGYSPARLSKLLGIGPRQLRRYTWRVHGKSPHDWLAAQRFSLALEILRKTRFVKSTAFELNYKQVSNFSRNFKAFHGISPKAFVAMIRASETPALQKASTDSPPASQPLKITLKLDA